MITQKGPGRIYYHHFWWDKTLASAMIILLHPRPNDDALFRKLKRMLADKSFGSITITYLFPLVKESSEDSRIYNLGKSCILRNIQIIEEQMEKCEAIIFGWGDKDEIGFMSIPLIYLAHKKQKELLCFGVTKEGNPRKPHYLSLKTPLFQFNL
jgi:hypothetical protein